MDQKQSLTVEVWLKETSKPIVYNDVTSTYTKGPLFCIYQAGLQRVTKWPFGNVWRIIESYPDSDRRTLKELQAEEATSDAPWEDLDTIDAITARINELERRLGQIEAVHPQSLTSGPPPIVTTATWGAK